MLISSRVFPGCSWVGNKPVKKPKTISSILLKLAEVNISASFVVAPMETPQ